MSKTDIGIDLGTANTVITLGKKGVVLSEPSAIAYHTHTKEVLAVGKRAYQMIGKTPDYIEVIRPLSGGVISDDRMTQYMIREFILQVTGHRLTKPRIIICVPSFITDVEKRAVVEAAMSAGSRKAYLIDEPIAALIGAGVNIGKARGNMVVDIGGGTTDVAIVSMNGIVTSHSVRAAGNTLDQAIIRYMQTKYKLLIGERTAERLKIEMTNLYDPRADVTAWVKGRNLVSGLPEMQEVSELEIFEAVEDVVADIIEAIKTVLEETPPELVLPHQSWPRPVREPLLPDPCRRPADGPHRLRRPHRKAREGAGHLLQHRKEARRHHRQGRRYQRGVHHLPAGYPQVSVNEYARS